MNLRFDTTGGVSLVDAVIDGAIQDFHFLKNPDKLKTLAAILGVTLKPENIFLQRVHITVRNVLEHTGGVLRPDDLSRLGVASIKLLNGEHDFVDLKAGDRIELSVWEALRPVRHLGELADELAAGAQ